MSLPLPISTTPSSYSITQPQVNGNGNGKENEINVIVKKEEPEINSVSEPVRVPSNGTPTIPTDSKPAVTPLPQSSSSFPGQVNAQAGPGPSTVQHSQYERTINDKKRKWSLTGYEEDELGLLEEEHLNLNLALQLDQTSTLYPSPPTRFDSYEDMVDRLMPYHVWQIYDEELNGQLPKSKEQELKEIQDASGLVERIRRVKDRFGKIRMRVDENSNIPSLIPMYQQFNQTLKEEISSLQTILRPLNAEYALIEKQQEDRRRAEEEKKRREEERLKAIEEERRRRVIAQQRAEEEMRRRKEEEENRRLRAEEERKKLVLQSSSNPINTNPIPPHPVNQPPSIASPPSTPSSSYLDRGKPRGRPRGRGRAGVREASTPHLTGQTNGIANANPNTPSPNPTSTSTLLPGGSSANRPTTPGTPGTPGQASTSASTPAGVVNKGPVSLTVNRSLIPQLISLELLLSNPTPTSPKTPATIIRYLEDKNSVVLSVNLTQCTKTQLIALAKLLNVSTKAPASTPGTATATAPTIGQNSSVTSSAQAGNATAATQGQGSVKPQVQGNGTTGAAAGPSK
ncbi:hypothetical protein V865_004997 [Kwoniella europaea PYCC6329]|uniref:GLTSCR protein conserved domain-containing protein n=1 Tax=Kwoniella europaea PYCC6329 TaxID=1423913 RepID=A0AAX4KN20_9TREE